MDDEAEAGRELERLRAELTGFVVDAMAERMASGAQPELSAALAEAIDRRVDRAVEARLAETRWPDPDKLAAQVAAAVRGTKPGTGVAKGRAGAALPFLLGFLTALGIGLVAYFTYSALRPPAPAPAAPPAPIANGVEPTSSGPVNVTVEGGNQAVPAAPANQQAPAR